MENPFPNPCTEWLSEKAWSEIVRASDLPNLKGLKDSECLGPLHYHTKIIHSRKVCSVNCYQRDPAAVKHGSLFAQRRQRSFIDSSLFVFNLSGFPDPGWKVFYDSATPNSERMPDPWDAVSGLDR